MAVRKGIRTLVVPTVKLWIHLSCEFHGACRGCVAMRNEHSGKAGRPPVLRLLWASLLLSSRKGDRKGRGRGKEQSSRHCWPIK